LYLADQHNSILTKETETDPYMETGRILHETIMKGSRPPREGGCFPMPHSLAPRKGQFFFIIKLKFSACEKKIYGCFKKRRVSSFFTPFNFPRENNSGSPQMSVLSRQSTSVYL
jgi:hypothetical protein